MPKNTHSLDLELSSSQYAARTDTTSLSITGDITVEAWINLEQLPSTAGTSFVIASKWDDNPTTQKEWVLYISSSGNTVFFGFNNFGSFASCDTALSGGDVGAWKHIAVSVDVSVPSFEFYFNGSLQSDTVGASSATSIRDGNSRTAIGAQHTSTTPILFFDGKIDEVRIWNDIRTSGEILANYKKQLVGNESNLVANWRFNNSYTDLTSNANDLTAYNTPTFSTSVPFIGDTGSLFFSQL